MGDIDRVRQIEQPAATARAVEHIGDRRPRHQEPEGQREPGDKLELHVAPEAESEQAEDETGLIPVEIPVRLDFKA